MVTDAHEHRSDESYSLKRRLSIPDRNCRPRQRCSRPSFYSLWPAGITALLFALPVELAAQTGLVGYADVHSHQFANLAFGGVAVWGKPFGPIEQALPPCSAHLGPAGALEGLMDIAHGSLGWHGFRGWPEFDEWPRWNSFTHQMVYQDWLRRAYEGGLRLMVMLAVNNGLACSQAGRAPGRTCDDMEALDLQIEAAKEMERYIDGGTGRGWYKIVYSAQQARDAIAQGKLAVVLGVELSNLFGCRRDGTCTEATVRQELDKYYERGLRHIFPIHAADNAFGAAAYHTPISDVVTLRNCGSEGYEYLAILGGGFVIPACNAKGLTELGKSFLRELMSRRMIFDIDHMSLQAVRNDVIPLAKSLNYPLISSHSGFLEISKGQKRNETALRPEIIEEIRNLGGMVAPVLYQGDFDQVKSWPSSGGTSVEHLCGGTSQTFAQAYLYAVDKMKGGPVAFGSDFNGFAGLPGPRFGSEACPGGTGIFRGSPQGMIAHAARAAAVGQRYQGITYPFQIRSDVRLPRGSATMGHSVVGQKTFDINTDGLAHVGMVPDFIEDLALQGLTQADLAPLFHSAEGYVQMWERMEALPHPWANHTALRSKTSDSVYIVIAGALFWIPNEQELLALNLQWANVRVLPKDVIARVPRVPANGTFLKERLTAPIYRIDAGRKRHIRTMEAFQRFGFSSANVLVVPAGSLQNIPDGPQIDPPQCDALRADFAEAGRALRQADRQLELLGPYDKTNPEVWKKENEAIRADRYKALAALSDLRAKALTLSCWLPMQP